MCLAVPVRIVELSGAEAVVEIDGVRRGANVAFVRDPKVGDYVLLHAGFAIAKWTEEDMREFREIMAEMDDAAPRTRREN
jgi:hydrogenase expression/formation protein HypC